MANEIEAPRRSHTTINVDELSRVVKNDQTVVVPGKVLGNGTIDKKVRISALQFSESAKVKISASGGTVVSMEQLLTENPKGSGITLIKGAQKRC
jgi:large subunit ribosomal protein L18e